MLTLFYSVVDEVVMEELHDWIDRGFTIVDTTVIFYGLLQDFLLERRSAFSTPETTWSTTSRSLLPFGSRESWLRFGLPRHGCHLHCSA